MASRFIFVLFVHSAFSAGKRFPDLWRSQTNGIETFQNGTIYEQVRYGHYTELECCSRNESQLMWMKWCEETKQWHQYLPDGINVRFLDSKQILAIKSSTFADAGLYKCSIHKNSSVTDVTTFQLKVIACDELARGPYPIAPLPCTETIAQEIKTLTLPCTGYFGCGEEGDIRIVTWYASLDKNKKDIWRKATSVDKRYNQTDFQMAGGAVKGSNLTIESVSALDFNRKFMCLLASPQMIRGQSNIIVTLRKDTTDRTLMSMSSFDTVQTLTPVCVVGAFSLIATVVAAILVIYQRCRKRKRSEEWKTILQSALVKPEYIECT